jgi:hypothetical protein
MGLRSTLFVADLTRVVVEQKGIGAWQIAPAAAAAVAAGLSAYAAFLANRRQRAYGVADTLLRVSERLDSPENAQIKDDVYRLWDRRDHFRDWSAEERRGVDRWCAQLDLIALLLAAEQLDLDAFFSMYGDVLLRSIYIVAPYANWQREERGRQFLLPLSELTARLIAAWRRLAATERYPREIGLRYADQSLTPGYLQVDAHVSAFRQERLDTK